MDAGHARLTRRAAALVSVAAAAACAASADAVPMGERFPLVSEGAPLAVVWVLRPDDYLTCQTAADGVRRLQRRYGGALPVSVVGVGAHPEWLRGFLRRQRIEAGIMSLSEEEFRRRFQRRPMPWLYLLRDGRVIDVVPGRGAVYPMARWKPAIDSIRAADARRGEADQKQARTQVLNGRSP